MIHCQSRQHHRRAPAVYRVILSIAELAEVEPLRLLTPFFELIRSPETGGPVTGTALGTLRRLISAGFFGLFEVGVAEAVNATAEAVTSCRFEATTPSADECVLFRILEVLGALVASAWGGLLSHDTLLNVLQAAYRIGHYQTEKGRATSGKEEDVCFCMQVLVLFCARSSALGLAALPWMTVVP